MFARPLPPLISPAASILALLPTLLLALSACPQTEPPPGGSATQVPEGSSGSPGSTGTTTDDPTTGQDLLTTSGAASTLEPGSSDSGDLTGSSGEPDPELCPYDLPGVQIAIESIVGGLQTDLSAQPCGSTSSGVFLITSANASGLELSACDDLACGACDPANTLALALTIPKGFSGLPPQFATGTCLQLDLAWNRHIPDPRACAASFLALNRRASGLTEPVPRFIYRHSESLPAKDTLDTFSLTADPTPPGAITCPCAGDCCPQEPGSLPLSFSFKLGQGEVGLLPLEPGLSLTAFELDTVEGNPLSATISLVRSTIPSACDTPPQHEWILRLVPVPPPYY